MAVAGAVVAAGAVVVAGVAGAVPASQKKTARQAGQ